MTFRSLSLFFVLAIAGLAGNACKKLDLDEEEDVWIQDFEFTTDFKVKKIYRLGDNVENRYLGNTGQGVAIRDRIMFRLYNKGYCQTYDISDLANPKKISTFELGSYIGSNHANCGQTYMDENGDVLLYVSGLRGGKTYVERITATGSTLVQTITLSPLDILGKTTTLNCVCSEDGHLWFFGGSSDRLYFAKMRRPLLSEGDVTLGMDDILDFWSEGNYVYNDDVWQGGKVYGNFLFFLFGANGATAHLVVYDHRFHKRILDIDLSDDVRNEPEDCELIPQGILVVTNGGNQYYLIRPE